jgi:hypothetical protein
VQRDPGPPPRRPVPLDMPDDEFYPVDRFIDDIVAAVRSDNALPPDPIGQSALAASIGAAAN